MRAMDERQARQQLSLTVDGLGEAVDPDITEALVAFLMAGFETYASCGGHADRALAWPWVQFQAADNTASGNAPQRARMQEMLAAHGTGRLVIQDQGGFGAFRLQADESHRDAAFLAENRAEMDRFAAFVRSRT